ncbi:CCR4-Not complex component, Not1-domain-containing protein [Protomyces lactucae-debilis]|uniref:General negative regulator of transcription subunit 1 n=1 Tax=Protomyces lactucae-debilis TaxID=2754530 RepID=A0A1Y2FVL3_PROLT|nr:CCR4-Not complex component, Not1-domain-containing protein [Protomyces lactucae-debilis]ORY87999.1 CCR4-Not complex component, Not1-domain-containing protein [Protomyces lactucae-debilis]
MGTLKEDTDRLIRQYNTDEGAQRLFRNMLGSARADDYNYMLKQLTSTHARILLSPTASLPNTPLATLFLREVQHALLNTSTTEVFAKALCTLDGADHELTLQHLIRIFDLTDVQLCLLAVCLMNFTKSASLHRESSDAFAAKYQLLLRHVGIKSQSESMAPSEIAVLARHLLLNQGCSSTLSLLQKFVIEYTLFQRYQEELPQPVQEFFEDYNQLRAAEDQSKSLAQLFEETRGAATSTITSTEQILVRRNVTQQTHDAESQIASVLVTLIESPTPSEAWNGEILGRVIQLHLPQLDWSRVIRGLDRPDMTISTMSDFALIITTLRGAISQGHRDMPVDLLWGEWRHATAQAALLKQLTQSPLELFNMTDYNGPTVLSANDFVSAPASLKNMATQLEMSPWNSLQLLQTCYRLAANESLDDAKELIDVASKSTPELIFLGSVQLPQPRSPRQEQYCETGFDLFFNGQSNHQVVFYRLWQVEPEFMCTKLIEYHGKDPLAITRILDIAHDLRLLDQLLNLQPYSFSLDLASLASRRDLLDIDKWLDHQLSAGQDAFIASCLRFLSTKAEAENMLQQSEGSALPVTVSLKVETVAVFLKALMNSAMSSENGDYLKQVQSSCLQVYPRLMNSTNVNRDPTDSNNFSKDVEKEVEFYYGRLYEGEMSIAHFVEMLQSLKQSPEARDQDVFACMLHSLFDEYRFFADYPASALSITAVLFGCLIENQLLSYIPLGIALRYILDAVAYDADSNMFRFGVQALTHFKDRVPEWPQYCQQILAIPSLNEHEPGLLAQIRNSQRSAESSARIAPHAEAPGPQAANARAPRAVFRSLRADTLQQDPAFYSDPPEDVSDKILFNINNMSLTNLSEKLAEVSAAMHEKYFAWFAEHLVSQRAAIEPNYHSLYIHFLEGIANERLTENILSQTVESISLLLNSENTVTSTVERSNLKNLGAWLGGLTLARNRPLKHKLISLKDLLLEGFDSGRLIVVLPFVCRILEQTPASKVFKPPNPWTMGILSLLVELYENADMKLNLKFEVEVLCKKLDVAMSDVMPSNLLTNRPNVPEDHESLKEDDSKAADSRANANIAYEQSAAYVSAVVGDLPIIVHPIIQQTLGIANSRRLILLAVERAVRDFIGPVVERSVAIASISTSQLISKDFAMEEDIGKLRRAAHTMNQNLAGSLALVTCKEPLRGALVTNVRTLLGQAGLDAAGGQLEDFVSQLVSDHLDAACMIVEKAAMERASTEIDEGLAAGFHARQKHKEQRSGQPFVDIHAPRHQYPLPDPLRLKEEGLTSEQLATYDDFSRIPRTAQQAAAYYSKESLRQPVQDEVLAFRGDAPVVAFDQILASIVEVEALSREADVTMLAELPSDAPLRKLLQQIPYQVAAISAPLRDERTMACSQKVCQLLFKGVYDDLVAESLTFLLSSFVNLSSKTLRDVSVWLVHSDDPRKYNARVIQALMRSQIISPAEFDIQLAKQIEHRQLPAIEFAVDFIKSLSGSSAPSALRADFTASLVALQTLAMHEDTPAGVKELLSMLSTPVMLGEMGDDSFKAQLEMLFSEWVHLVNHPATNDANQLAFLLQLQKSGMLSSDDSCTAFFRHAIEYSLAAAAHHASAPGTQSTAHYIPLDALAKLIVLMMKYQVGGRFQEMCLSNFGRIVDLATVIFAHQHLDKAALDQRPMFRFYSSLFSELHKHSEVLESLYPRFIHILADALLVLQPSNFPKYAFAWIALISHRFFLPQLLGQTESSGWAKYAELMTALLRFVGPSLESVEMNVSVRVIYHALLRLLLVLLNDFPNFLTNNHQVFCNHIPARCIQLRNLILSSFPRKMRLPDPFLPGLKVDRLPETAISPEISMDLEQILVQGKVMNSINNYIYSGNLGTVPKVIKALSRNAKSEGLEPVLLNTLVLHCAVQAITNADAPPAFDLQSPWVALLNELFSLSDALGRYQILSAITNQLRYPNSHTYFFSCVLLLLFSSSSGDQDLPIKEQITRVLLERLICNRPHPWGLLITFTELLKNSKYNFWSLPFRTSPEIESLFQSLFSHINQNIE